MSYANRRVSLESVLILSTGDISRPDFGALQTWPVLFFGSFYYICFCTTEFLTGQWTGKKCYFLGARDLNIVWSDTPEYWEWISPTESRFPKVALLKVVWWLEIWSTIRAGILSPLICYAVYFVYKLNKDYYSGFDPRDVEVSVGISGVESKNMQIVCLTICDSPYNPPSPYLTDDWPDDGPLPKLRDDGWFELEIGEFLTENKDDCIELRVQEVKRGLIKQDLIVEGIEIRPKIA
ncbi:hypothetical protein T459_29737 [Capsicum annuum]|uniref:F-box protein PP2-B12 n=1 Tax=Capsicum annuum TaxID=4072 RepID=A0A2G2Y6G6_CAPAN|nr:hypothetical protein T459_29737 [Capsicum annuum]